MSKLTDVIAAMREASGAEPRLVSAWIELAQTNNVLRDALKQVFGRRFPTPQKFGGWLNENLGTKAGELTLLGQHSTHAKAWRYGVFIPADVAEAARAAAERKAARDAERDARLAKEAARQERRNPAPELAIRVQPPPAEFDPHAPPSGHFAGLYPNNDYIVRRDPNDPGRLIRERLPPVPAPKPAESSAVEKPPASTPQTRVEAMRAKYLQHHTGATPGPGGFLDVGGVVARNIQKEQAASSRVRVTGYWPGGPGIGWNR